MNSRMPKLLVRDFHNPNSFFYSRVLCSEFSLIDLNIRRACVRWLRMFCRPLRASPETRSVRSGTFEGCYNTSESASHVCARDEKPRAKGLRSARTDIVVFLAFISKSRSGGCPAAEGLVMKANFHRGLFSKKKKIERRSCNM